MNSVTKRNYTSRRSWVTEPIAKRGHWPGDWRGRSSRSHTEVPRKGWTVTWSHAVLMALLVSVSSRSRRATPSTIQVRSRTTRRTARGTPSTSILDDKSRNSSPRSSLRWTSLQSSNYSTGSTWRRPSTNYRESRCNSTEWISGRSSECGMKPP